MTEVGSVPEIYADVVQIATGNVGVFLGFRSVTPFILTPGQSEEPESHIEAQPPLKAVVRLSAGNAKVFAILFRRALKQYEEDFGVIPIPEELSQLLGSADNEW